MARRPVFRTQTHAPFSQEVTTEFEYHPGFSHAQKQKSVMSLHRSYAEINPGDRVLEISTKSPEGLGVALSAFVLTMPVNGNARTVECLFQGSKVFEQGGPFTDLYSSEPIDAKRDERLRNSGSLTGFNFLGTHFPLDPTTYFYDWLYVQALSANDDLATSVLEYQAFTDIEFNPKRSLNSQAQSAARFVGLARADLLEEALRSPKDFLRVVYPASPESDSMGGEGSQQFELF